MTGDYVGGEIINILFTIFSVIQLLNDRPLSIKSNGQITVI